MHLVMRQQLPEPTNQGDGDGDDDDFFTVQLCEAYTHGIAVEILSVCPSVRLTVPLSNACIVTKRKHLVKKVQI